MSKAQKFEDLTIFQKARDLCKEVYAITKDGEFHKDSRFVQQIDCRLPLSRLDNAQASLALCSLLHRFMHQ